jgi:hypothetical protein
LTANPFGRPPVRFGFATGVPPDVVALLAVVFVTFSLQFFAATAGLVELLRLSPRVWTSGFVWQLVTYPFAGVGAPTIWILLELFVLFWFARDVLWRLGRARFWRLIGWSTLAGGLVAVGVDLALRFAGWVPENSLVIPQGQRMLLALVTAAFAVLFRDAQILLFFVLPLPARWLLPLELLVAFIAFLASHDLAGLLGLYAGVATAWGSLRRGGLQGGLREAWLGGQQWWLRQRMARLRRKRGFKVVAGQPRDPWLHRTGGAAALVPAGAGGREAGRPRVQPWSRGGVERPETGPRAAMP